MTLCTMSLKCTGGSNHEEPARPAFRARCLRLAPRDPRWAYHFRPCSFRRQGLSTASGTHDASGGRSRRTTRRRKSPVTRGRRIGTSRLGPPRRALRTPATATAPANPGLVGPFQPEEARRRISSAVSPPSPHLSALERALEWDEVDAIMKYHISYYVKDYDELPDVHLGQVMAEISLCERVPSATIQLLGNVGSVEQGEFASLDAEDLACRFTFTPPSARVTASGSSPRS